MAAQTGLSAAHTADLLLTQMQVKCSSCGKSGGADFMTKNQLKKCVSKRRCKTCAGSSETIWVQLVVGNQIPVVDLITVSGTLVVNLRHAVKEQMPEGLTHCMAADLQVFLQGAATASHLSEPIPTTTSEDHPVIVTAPPRQGRYLC
jgi:hypothetical protein